VKIHDCPSCFCQPELPASASPKVGQAIEVPVTGVGWLPAKVGSEAAGGPGIGQYFTYSLDGNEGLTAACTMGDEGKTWRRAAHAPEAVDADAEAEATSGSVSP
jgi:hypothetical protein